jgi:4-amino-4-deoxy-L-arabinose transferase-like glycosyltransferase
MHGTASPNTPLARALSAIPDRIGFWLALHVCLWTLFHLVTSPDGVHHDMSEAYAWGREFELGYYKHPPFWAAIAGLWFAILPRGDAAFYLLAMLNAGIGLWGVWLLAGRYLSPERRLMAVLLMQFVPFFHFLAYRYNANTILISIWPFALYFYLRMIEERSWGAAVLLGIAGGIGLLSKYYVGLLLLSFAILTLADPKRRAILFTPLPWIAAATALAVAAPHLVWLWQNDFLPLRYVQASAGHDFLTRASRAVSYLAGLVAFHLVMLGVFMSLARRPFDALAMVLRMPAWERERNHLVALTVLPHLLTVAVSLIAGVKIDTNFALATFPLVPIILLTTPGIALKSDAVPRLKGAALGFMGVLLILSPAIGYIGFATKPERGFPPNPALAPALERIWSGHVDAPLLIAGGMTPYAETVTFYAFGAVSAFPNLTDAFAPWITQERIKREGIAVICLEVDAGCIAAAQARLGEPQAQEVFTLERRQWGKEGAAEGFVALIYPPRP